MKPTLMLTLIALAITACTRTDERLATRTVTNAQAAAPVATGERQSLATLPPMSPDADDVHIVDYSTGD